MIREANAQLAYINACMGKYGMASIDSKKLSNAESYNVSGQQRLHGV